MDVLKACSHSWSETASPPWCSSSSSGCFRRTSRLWCRTLGWCPDAQRGGGGQGDRTQWKVQNEHKEAAMPSWLSSLLVLQASCAHHGSSVVGRCDGLKPLLSRCVPAQSTYVWKNKKKRKKCCFVIHKKRGEVKNALCCGRLPVSRYIAVWKLFQNP